MLTFYVLSGDPETDREDGSAGRIWKIDADNPEAAARVAVHRLVEQGVNTPNEVYVTDGSWTKVNLSVSTRVDTSIDG